MLTPIFHDFSVQIWNINHILEQDDESEQDISQNEENNPDSNSVPEQEIFDEEEENLSISECF